jgi:outer membrane protein OmpA-like peptidoglycan-associated protein
MAKKGFPPIVYILFTLALAAAVNWLFKSGRLTAPPIAGLDASRSERSNERQNGDDLVLLGDTFSGYSTFRDGDFQALLAESGLRLVYEDVFDQGERAAQLDRGDADLLVTTLDRFLQHQPQGRIIALIDRTIGADAVVLNTPKYPQLQSLNDLKTLSASGVTPTITYAEDTPSEYLARVLNVQFEGFDLSSFQVIGVAEASDAWALLQDPNQAIAVAVLWEPFVTQAKRQGYTVVLSSNDTPNTIVDVLVASDRAIADNPEAIAGLLTAYYRHIDSNTQNNARLKAQIQADGDLSAEDAELVLQGIDFFTSIEADQWMQDGTLAQRLQATGAILTLAGEINAPPTEPDSLYSPQFIREAVTNTETLIGLIEADNPTLAAALKGQPIAAETAPVNPEAVRKEVQTATPIGNLNIRGEVKFTTGSAQLTPDSLQTLDRLATEIGEFNTDTVAVRVIGHTSQTGSAQLNQTLSQQRAQAVVTYLESRGISRKIIAEGKGYSETLPNIAPTDIRNQRTEIRLVRLDS